MADTSLQILVVDANATDLLLLEEALAEVRTFEFALNHVKRLDAALQCLHDKRFDAVLLHLGLPDSQGLETFVRMQREHPAIPILILSGLDDEALAMRAVQGGAQDFLVKGKINGTMLARTIRYAIERKRSEQNLLASEAGYRRLFETAQDGIFILDAETGQITDANPFLEKLLGYTSTDFIGKRLWEIGPFRDKAASQAAFATLQEKGYIRYDALPLLTRDGLQVDVEFISNIYAVGTQRVIQCNIRDITERKESESLMRQIIQGAHCLLWTAMVREVDGVYHWTLSVPDPEAAERFLPLEHQPDEAYFDAWSRSRLPEDRPACYALAERAVREGWLGYSQEYRCRDAQSQIHWLAEDVHIERTAADQWSLVGVCLDITERKQAEEALRQSHDELEMRVTERTAALAQANVELQLQKTILEAQGEASIDGILVVSAVGQIMSYNQRFVEMWDIEPEVIATRVDATVLKSAVTKVREPQAFLDQVAYLYQHPEAASREEILLQDGRTFDRYSAPVRSADGAHYGRIWFFRDISDRRQVEAALRASQERFRQMTECVSEVFWMNDQETNRLLYISPAYEAVWGRPCAELYASPQIWIDAIHPEDQQRILEAALTKQIQGEFDEHYRIIRPDGETRWIRDRAFPVKNEAGEVYRMVGIAEDITERHRAQVAIQAAREEAERANRSKSEFLSRMSHELRTPMNAILGFGQILEMRDLGPKESQSVAHILKAGRHLLELINEVLDISRIEAGQMALSLDRIHVTDTVTEALDLVRPLAAQRHIQLVNAVAPQVQWHVVADRQRLKQVLLNLLANAVKYNREAGQVTVSGAIQTVATGGAGETLRLSISDTGSGLSAADLAKLFVPFERMGAAQMGVEGTGMGLALSRQLVEVMGGKMGVESTVGVGSVFWIELRLTPSPIEQLQHLEVQLPVPAVAATTPSTVLYIEDNLPNLTLIEHVLAEDATISLLSAMQGSVGLDLARQHHPDLILLDLHLPDMSGEEVLRRLRAQPATRGIPVVVISADVTPRQVDRLLLAGAKAYLTKPLDLKQFLQVVTETLNERDE